MPRGEDAAGRDGASMRPPAKQAENEKAPVTAPAPGAASMRPPAKQAENCEPEVQDKHLEALQ